MITFLTLLILLLCFYVACRVALIILPLLILLAAWIITQAQKKHSDRMARKTRKIKKKTDRLK